MESRYNIYELLGWRVKIDGALRIKEGTISRIHRNIHTEKIELCINGKKVSIEEPDEILYDGSRVVLCYGKKIEDVQDEFEEIKNNPFETNIDDFFSKVKESSCKVIMFSLVEYVSPPSKRWRSRGAYAGK